MSCIQEYILITCLRKGQQVTFHRVAEFRGFFGSQAHFCRSVKVNEEAMAHDQNEGIFIDACYKHKGTTDLMGAFLL